MNDTTIRLLRVLRKAEAEHLDNYDFANVQQSFSELLATEPGLDADWTVLSMRGNQSPLTPEYTTDDRILIFCHQDQLYSFTEHILVYEECHDAPIFHLLQFNFTHTIDDDQLEGYQR